MVWRTGGGLWEIPKQLIKCLKQERSRFMRENPFEPTGHSRQPPGDCNSSWNQDISSISIPALC